MGTIVPSFTSRWWNGGTTTRDPKCIVRTDAVRDNGGLKVHVHNPLRRGWCSRCADGTPLAGSHCKGAEANIRDGIWQLNHYAIQSHDWFMEVKARRGDVSTGSLDGVRDEAYFTAYDQNDVTDTQLADKKKIHTMEGLWGGLARIADTDTDTDTDTGADTGTGADADAGTTAAAPPPAACVQRLPDPTAVEARVPLLQCQVRLRQLLACAGEYNASSSGAGGAGAVIASFLSSPLSLARVCHKSGSIAHHVAFPLPSRPSLQSLSSSSASSSNSSSNNSSIGGDDHGGEDNGEDGDGVHDHAGYIVAVGSVIHVNGAAPPYEYAVRAGFGGSAGRSKASAHERLTQTLNRTIPSIRSLIPGAHIVLLEQGGPLTRDEREQLAAAVDTLIVMRDFDYFDTTTLDHGGGVGSGVGGGVGGVGGVGHFVDGPYKGLGEAYTMFQFATALHHQRVRYKQWFKLSGRYWLQQESFDFEQMRNERKFVFGRGTDGNPTTSFFYSVPRALNYRFIAQMARMLALAGDDSGGGGSGGNGGGSGGGCGGGQVASSSSSVSEPVMEQLIDKSLSPDLVHRVDRLHAMGLDGITGGPKYG
jgi:hypothetical protein